MYVIPDGIEDIDDERNIKPFPSLEDLKYKYVIKCNANRRIPKFLLDEKTLRRSIMSAKRHHEINGSSSNVFKRREAIKISDPNLR